MNFKHNALSLSLSLLHYKACSLANAVQWTLREGGGCGVGRKKQGMEWLRVSSNAWEGSSNWPT